MKKIGILTFHRAINYGASLQTFALMTVIKGIGNFEVCQLDTEQPYITDGSKLFNIRKQNLIRSLIGSIIRFPAKAIRNYKFNKFWEKRLNFSKPVFGDFISEQIDYIIVGSDQVWNFDIIGDDLRFFLDINTKEASFKKISYAASIGKSKLNRKEEEILQNHLADFNSISVREKSAQKLLHELNIDSEVVLDPTLLLNKNEWLSLFNNSNKIKNRYILVYTLEKNELVDQVVHYYKKELNISQVVYISSSINLHKISNTFSPEDFIELFNGAEFIITNSFHGTAFSVNFSKNFVTIPHKTRNSRMIDFLKMVNLNEQIIYKLTDLEVAAKDINYTDINVILETERLKSIDYLRKALR